MSLLGSVSALVQEISKVHLAPNKPIVGNRVFTVESGVVTHIIQEMEKLGCRTGMTPYTPELVGHKPIQLVIGQGTGKHTIGYFLNLAGIETTDEEADEILRVTREEASIRKGLVETEDLEKIAKKVLNKVK